MKIETATRIAEYSADIMIVMSIGFAAVLSGFKVANGLDWSWALVLAPVYIGIPIGCLAPLAFLIWYALRQAKRAE